MTGPVSAVKTGFSESSESFWVGSHWAREIRVEKDKICSKTDNGKGERIMAPGILSLGLEVGEMHRKT